MKQGCADKHVWVNPNYYGSSTEGLINQEGNIWGLEAGWDMQYNSNNRLGLFVSYRKGDYEADERTPVGCNLSPRDSLKLQKKKTV